MVEDRQDLIAELERVLPEGLEVVDYDEFLLVVDEHGMHVAVVDHDPLQLEFELSVVLLDENKDLEAQCEEAREVVDRAFEETWGPKGFRRSRDGKLVEGEALDDPTATIWSWDHTLYARPRDMDELGELLRWGCEQDVDYVLA